MKEDQQDAQGHYIAYGELIDGEEALIDCTVVGELIADGMLIDKPANKQACKESAHRQHDLCRDEVAEVEQRHAEEGQPIDGSHRQRTEDGNQ